MTQEEEEDLEDLSSLEIREDHGAEDSDVTPINTPPSTPPILYIKKYPPVNPHKNEETQVFRKLSKTDDYDCRSESSLSWGDDEFEGEATKQVSLLFDQVDNLLYGEDQSPAILLSPESASPKSVEPPFCQHDPSTSSNSDYPTIDLPDIALDSITVGSDDSRTKYLPYGISLQTDIDNDDQSSEKFFSYGNFLTSKTNSSSDQVVVSEPSPELEQECHSWVYSFPHYRIRGHFVDPIALEKSEKNFLEDCLNQEEGEEEVIAYDGEFEHLLPLVNYTSANQVKILSKETSSKHSTPNSRVCSGSNDPEVLKEQVLIALFDKLWDSVTKVVDPLLHQYAKYVIEQSVQYMSISREPSTRGLRGNGQRAGPQNASDDVRTKNSKFLSPVSVVGRPFSGRSLLPSRPSSGMRRPESAAQRLNKSMSIPDVQQHEDLQDLLQVTAKPLQNGEGRVRSYPSSTTQTRESSASSRMSQLSLPLVNTPRDAASRPISSKSTSRHLTPVKTKLSVNLAEQRPASTSSYNSRMRIQERFQHLNRQFTIQELGTDNTGLEVDEETQDQPSPVWSRHIPFLPPIGDNAVIPLKLQNPPGASREDKAQPSLYVKGTLMSASHYPDGNKRAGRTRVSGMKPVEPFLSWVVDKVDSNKTQLLSRDKHQVVKNSLIHEDSKSSSMLRTKHFRRYSHH